MKLQTEIPLKKQSDNLIDYQSNVVLFGSCFSDNIGGKLDYFKFKNLQNPFGVLFQPKAIEVLVENAVNLFSYTEEDVFFQNEQWHCFDAHSKLSSSSKSDLLDRLNAATKLTQQNLKEATHIVITLGSAWVYRAIATKQIVANCHKIPQKEFTKELLTISDISNSLKHISDSIHRLNTNASIIFTVSPVRHIKDGYIENTRSKAHLISGIHQFINQKLAKKKNTLHYFPSYEIMLDELRDYRFYNPDMLHPNETAITYIWEKFQETWVTSEAVKTMREVEVIQNGLRHKPFNPNSEAHLKFLQALEIIMEKICKTFPHINFK